jgi:hypothetical protein
MSNFTRLLLAYTHTLAILRPNRVTCWESICSRVVVLCNYITIKVWFSWNAAKEESEGKFDQYQIYI